MKHKRNLTILPPTAPLEFIAFNIPGPLPPTRSGNHFVVVIADRHSGFMRVVTTTNDVNIASCDNTLRRLDNSAGHSIVSIDRKWPSIRGHALREIMS